MSKRYSSDLINFVTCTVMYDSEPCDHYEIADVQYDINEWIKEGYDLPEDMTAESFCDIANEIIANNEKKG